jgi:hypothetical protein
VDPDQALKNAREAAQRYRASNEVEGERNGSEAAFDLVDAFEALDGWLSKGGFLPEDWAKGRPTA